MGILQFLAEGVDSEVSIPVPSLDKLRLCMGLASDAPVGKVPITLSLDGPVEAAIQGEGEYVNTNSEEARTDVSCGPVHGGTLLKVSLREAHDRASAAAALPMYLVFTRKHLKHPIATQEVSPPVYVSGMCVRSFVVPTLPAAGSYALHLSHDPDGDASDNIVIRGERFLAYHHPVAYWAKPAVTAVHGGSLVSIRGSGFPDTGDLKILIRPNAVLYPKAGGDTTVHARYLSSHELNFLSPAVESPFRGELHLSCNGGRDYASLNLEYEAHDTPHIERLAPFTGPTGGGTQVTVFTKNMDFVPESDIVPLVKFVGIFEDPQDGSQSGNHHCERVVEGALGGRGAIEAADALRQELEATEEQRRQATDSFVARVLERHERVLHERITALEERMAAEHPGEVSRTLCVRVASAVGREPALLTRVRIRPLVRRF